MGSAPPSVPRIDMTDCTQREQGVLFLCSFPCTVFALWHELLGYNILLTVRRERKDDRDDNVIEHCDDKW